MNEPRDVRVYIDMAPPKKEKCCSNCSNFYWWGVSLGMCMIAKGNVDKLRTQGIYCKKFERDDFETGHINSTS